MSRTGRKRKSGIREPNGRISRQMAKPADPMVVARAARENIHHIAKADSATDLAGTVVGRLSLRRLLSRRDIDAAKTIADRWQAYARAIDLGASEPQAVDLGRVHGRSSSEMSPAQAVRAIERWDEVVAALDAAGKRGHLYAIVYEAVIRDRETRTPHLLAFALDVIGDMLGLPLDKASEAA